MKFLFFTDPWRNILKYEILLLIFPDISLIIYEQFFVMEVHGREKRSIKILPRTGKSFWVEEVPLDQSRHGSCKILAESKAEIFEGHPKISINQTHHDIGKELKQRTIRTKVRIFFKERWRKMT
jgi:hypothetical protein